MSSDERQGDQTEAPASGRASTLRPLFNWVSIFGSVLLTFGLSATFFYGFLSLFPGDAFSYGGLTMLPLLAAAVLGAGMVVLGVVLEQRRRRGERGASISEYSLHLNPRTQNQIVVAFISSAVVVWLGTFLIGSISLRTLDYAESNEFCGSQCHQIMNPEATAYRNSPHSRVECVECHVGDGSESFIRAKLNGMRQILAAATGSFSRPIPTPIHNLRPSREICESCHSPDQWIDFKLLSRTYFRGDEANTRRSIRMMMMIGGEHGDLLGGAGIHYHMLSAQKVEFIATDPGRQDIRWVRITRDDDSVTTYEHAEKPLGAEERESLAVRTMECLDCHNRPSHLFEAPTDAVNRLLNAGRLPRTLPFIKRESVRALAGEYATTQEALAGISASLRGFYSENFPEVVEHRGEELNASIYTLSVQYQNTIFPEMKADWSAHPNNIGHRNSPGCFRCHNYEMESDDGDTIFRNCNTCHVILAQIDPEEEPYCHLSEDFEAGTHFLHPSNDEYIENQTLCSDCHNGGFRLYEKAESERLKEARLTPQPLLGVASSGSGPEGEAGP